MQQRKQRRVRKTFYALSTLVCAALLVVIVSAASSATANNKQVPVKALSAKAATEVVVKEVVVEKEVIKYVMTPYERTWSDDDLFYLAVAIYQEAGGDACSNETRIAIGNVVINRTKDPRFPDTIYDVLTAEGQWGRLHWTGIVFPERAFHKEEAHAVSRAYDCARRVLDGEVVVDSDVVWAAEFEQGETVLHQDGTYFGR